MRNYPASFLDGSATLSLCWRLTRKDGVVFGFTQHDKDLVFAGVVHEAASGLEVGKADHVLLPHQSTTRLLGALSSEKITERDIAAGFYDQARIETWLVNWQDTQDAVLVDSGVIGEIRRSDQGFVVEVRSLADQWQQPRGRLYQALCAADLGDAQCKVSLQTNNYRCTGQVLATDGQHGFSTNDQGHVAGLFYAGLVRFTSGANQGVAVDVRNHSVNAGVASFTLWRPLPALLATGDQFVVTAGCDKQISTCHSRFGNQANYRGFPRMPGNDVLLRRVSDGTPGLDGGSLFQ